MASLLQTSVDGLLMGALYGVAGLGFGFIYIVVRRLDLAYGAGLMAGTYAAVAFAYSDTVPFWVSFGIGLPVTTGVLAYSQWLCFPPRPPGHAHAAMAATFMVWMQIEEAVTLAMPVHHYTFPSSLTLPDLEFSLIAIRSDLLCLAGVSVALTIALAGYLHRSVDGRAIRATVQNRAAAALCGISGRRVWVGVLLISATLGTVAALSIAAVDRAITPMFGMTLTMKALVVLAAGGTDGFRGPLIGGYSLGLLEAHVQALAGPQWREFALYGALFVWLSIRPLASHLPDVLAAARRGPVR
jgi:branched-subunit amino acid ABC-type transport system permease component